MDEEMLENICVRLKHKFYVKESKILTCGGVIDQIIFIVQGKLTEVVDRYGITFPLSDGDAFGKDLIPWCFDPYSSLDKDWLKPGVGFLSPTTVTCLTNVEAFSLNASDLKQVIDLFPCFLSSPAVQRAIRFESPYWRRLAAVAIRDAWDRHKRREYALRQLYGKHTLAVKNDFSLRCVGQEYREP
ncbi:hypothetical protein ACHQM5_005325 [Ranunculus cassubicifolius]